MLKVNSLSKAYGKKENKVEAVKNISFSISKGEILGLVGESGCGKSTIAKLLLMLEKPDSGCCIFNDMVLFDCEKKEHINCKKLLQMRKDMQMIFQNPHASLCPHINIFDIVKDGVIKHKICDKSEIDDYISENLKQCGIVSEYFYKYPHELSGGEKQRVSIARSLALKPSFIVCDEPTSALDVSIQSQILNLMLDLSQQQGITLLFISHNLGVVSNFCNNVLIMQNGEIVEKGNAKELMNSPKHPYTKKLISCIPNMKFN